MTPSQWARVKELFEMIHLVDEDERQRSLDSIDDMDVRAEVASLLKANSESDGFLDTPAAANATATIPGLSALGQRVGNYVLRRVAGEGGDHQALDAGRHRAATLPLRTPNPGGS